MNADDIRDLADDLAKNFTEQSLEDKRAKDAVLQMGLLNAQNQEVKPVGAGHDAVVYKQKLAYLSAIPYLRVNAPKPEQAGHAEMRRRIEFQRIEKIGIDPAQQHVEPLQTGNGADMDAVAADGEIVALDQQEPEVARQRRMFEIGFAELAGRE